VPPAPDRHYTRTHRCRACGNSQLTSVLDLGMQALTGRFPGPDEPDPPIAPLELVICDTSRAPEACGLVQLAHTCDASLMYGATYGYRSSVTKMMVAHLQRTADQVLADAQVRPGDGVLEIGSNDGTMQKYLAGRGLRLVAMDPSAGKFASDYPEETTLLVNFFSAHALQAAVPGQKFKAVISLSMFYDLEEPLRFMQEIRDSLEPDGLWCFEQAYLPPTFTALCYDTICHEHLAYYGLQQIQWLAKNAGLKLIDVATNDVNGGSFRVYAARADSKRPANTAALNAAFALEDSLLLARTETWAVFAQRVREHRARVEDFFETAHKAGDMVLGLGASTKLNVVLQYAGVTPAWMPAIGERDPLKVGLRTPRTGIPIIFEEDARRQNPRYFFVGPWHFRDEIVAREKPFLDGGGKLVFPLPKFEFVTA
jgi:NDP-4-keto-2,6-dideoxyhexose 3-C-methyltransferase